MKSSISRCLIASSLFRLELVHRAGAGLGARPVYNQCSAYPGGGNRSPELSWTHAPRHTVTFIVIAYDVTASFTHWGIYNNAPTTTELPENAGITGSAFGLQVHNDFSRSDLKYDGPCPPTTLNPKAHEYVFTVYALDTAPTLPSLGDFPPGAEALFQALITAGRRGGLLPAPQLEQARSGLH